MRIKHLCTIALAMCFITPSFAQQLQLNFDFSNAQQTIAYMKSGKADPQKIEQLVQMPSTKALLRKIRVDSSLAVNALLSVHDSTLYKPAYQKFQYRGIKRFLPAMADFVQLISAKQDSIKKEVEAALSGFLPAGKKLRIKVSFLLGGNSSGFTLGDDSVFYLGLHHYRSDVTGVIESCKHELFHNIQHLYRDHFVVSDSLEKKGSTGLAYVHYMTVHLFQEGSAEYVADLRKVKSPNAPYIKEIREHAAVNDYRSEEVFYLISKMLAEAYEHPEKTDQNQLYSILFDWNWNNPGYYAGYVMTKALCEEYGEQVLMKYLGGDPSVFVADYIRLTKEKKDKYPLRFTEEFEKMITVLAERVKTVS